MSVLTLTCFPTEVIEQILLFVPTPRAVCRVGAACSSLLELVTTNERIWNQMYKRRWTMHESSQAAASFSRQVYIDRHVRDGETIRRLELVSKDIEKEEDYGLGRAYTSPTWNELKEDGESFDILRSIAKNDSEVKSLYTNAKITPVTQSLSTELLVIVHNQRLVNSYGDFNASIHDESYDDAILLEEGVLVLAQILWSWRDLLSSDIEARLTHTRKKLNKLASQLQSRISDFQSMETAEVVTLLNTMLLDEMGFEGNADNYHDVKNSSIEWVLKSRKGSPLTLAIIYKLILYRVGVTVDIIGLPGHVVLGIPGGEAFVDVFNGGRSLLVHDCRDIARSYNMEWNERILQPLTLMHTLIRMAYRAEICQIMALRQSTTTRVYASLFRLSAFLNSLGEWIPNHRVGLSPFMDPEIFRHFNLINDDTVTRRYAEFVVRTRYA